MDNNKSTISKYLYFAIIWGLLTSAFTLIPSNDIPYSRLISIYDLDNIIHASIFLIFSLLLFIGLKESDLKLKANPYILTITISILYGLILELIQIPIPHRGFEYLDLTSNIVGSFLGVSFGHLFRQMKNR